jgi:hypothetical protein
MLVYRAGSANTVASEVAKYKLDLVTVQEVRWDQGGSQPVDIYSMAMEVLIIA